MSSTDGPDLPHDLLGPRLLLRRARLADGPALGEALGETLDDLAPWFRWAESLRRWGTVEDLAARAHVAEQRYQHATDPTYFLWERAPQPRLVGEVVLFTGGWRFGVLILQYWVRRSAWGRGYAREGCGLLLRQATEHAGAEYVEAECGAANHRSRRLLLGLGFERFGLGPSHERYVLDRAGAAATDRAPVAGSAAP